MNCQDIARLLDNRDIDGLSAAERRGAEQHLSTCRQCASEWEAHERMLAVPVPPIPDRLAARCRDMIGAAASTATAPAGPGRQRVGTRSALIGALVLVGAAAAAVLTVELNDRVPGEPTVLAPGETADARAPFAQTAATGIDVAADALETEAAPTPDAGSAVQAAGRSGTTASGGFTVAVSALVQRSTHPDVVAISESIYAALLDELRADPALELKVLEATSYDFAETYIGVSPAELTIRALPEPIAAAATVSDENVRLRGLVPAGAAPGVVVDVPTGEGVNIDAGALIVAPVAATDGQRLESPANVNVMVGTRPYVGLNVTRQLDVVPSASQADPGYDYLLSVTNSGHTDPGSSQPESFSFRVSGSRPGRTDDRITLIVGGSVYEPVDAEKYARDTVETLRRMLFEPDDALLDEIRTVFLDQSATTEDRLNALRSLEMIAGRSGVDGRTGPIVEAAIELAASVDEDAQRAEIWRLMYGAEDLRLVQPLVDALLYDSAAGVRRQAARTLETFAADPSAAAALASASSFDAAAVVRRQAKWSSLSDSGRRAFVNSTLLDTSLSDAERVEPLLFAMDAVDGLDPRGGNVLDEAGAVALIGLIRRAESPDSRLQLLPHVRSSDRPEVTALLIDRLQNDSSDLVRTFAAELLGARIDAPGVRPALESARTSDQSVAVRNFVARALGDEVSLAPAVFRAAPGTNAPIEGPDQTP